MRLFTISTGLKVGLLTLGGWLAAGPGRAQPAARHCLLLPLAPAQRAQQASLVVEAEVRTAESFWNTAHTRLYTRHRLRVAGVLKGSLADTAGLVLVTEGGRLGLQQQVLSNTLHLEPGQQGVLFLQPAPWPGLPAGGRTWAAYGSQQGFIEYQLADGTASEPFRHYPRRDAAFYAELAAYCGQPRQVLLPAPAPAVGAALRTQAPRIAGLQPAALAAGAGAVLTIAGEGFENARGSGYVEFRNADDGGATWVKARETDYLSWSPTRVQLRVPSYGGGGHPAGSGLVRLTTSGQARATSPDSLTIVYALTNVANTTGTVLQRPNHVAANGAGGLDFYFGPNFGAAAAPWLRALASWRCQTGINWRVADFAADNTIADDGRNLVAFDTPADELPAQVLGRTTSYYQGCYGTNGDVVFYVAEVDMQFDNERSLQLGPTPAQLAQIDFETVVVHELGHAQQLSHLIRPGAVMHYGIAPAQTTRTLDPASDVAGGRQVLRERSFRPQGCGAPPMLPAPLTAFAAQSATPAVALSWATRDECNLLALLVQRSPLADTLHWETLATLLPTAAGSYAYADAAPRPGLHYYRLGLRRPDGSVDYAVPVPVYTGSTQPGVAIFPNPLVGSSLQFQYPATGAGTLHWQLYDELGRLLWSRFGPYQPGLNVLGLDVGDLPAGFFVLRWADGAGPSGSFRLVRW